MSLGIAIKAPEGIVLAAESRVTLTSKQADGSLLPVYFDNAMKMWGLEAPNNHIGVVTWGLGAIGMRTAHSFQSEFEANLKSAGDERLTVEDVANKLSEFYMGQWQLAVAGQPNYAGPPMTFMIAGVDEGQPYGRVFQIDIPFAPKPVEHQKNANEFGITWGGQREIVDRLLNGFDHRLLEILKKVAKMTDEEVGDLAKEFQPLQLQLPLAAMALQDCVDLALFFVRTTIAGLALTVDLRGCGGHIDVATITRREGFRYVQRKKVVGERREQGREP